MRLLEPFEFFVDRSLGARVVVRGLRDAGEIAHVHDEHFAQDTNDETWLRAVGEKGWVVFTKDVNIRRQDTLPRRALLAARVAAFVLARGDVAGPSMAAAFVAALPRIKRALRAFDVPLIASVRLDGGVALMHDANGPLERSKELR